MQREILLKAKRKDNGEWVEGQIVYDKDKTPFIIEEVERENQDEVTDLYATSWYEVIPETICQYTGRKDKNSVKIFENDILVNSITNSKCVVKFYDTRFMLSYIDRLEDVPMYNFMNRMSSLFEVIGNKFDEVDNNE